MGGLVGCFVGGELVGLPGRLDGWLVGWLTGWFVGA